MAQKPVLLALVDVPNINMSFYELLHNRPHWGALHSWLLELATEKVADLEPWAYLNQEVQPLPNRYETQAHLRHVGFKTHLNQKQLHTDDIDNLLVRKLYRVWESRPLAGVVIVSHDMKNFRHEIRELEIAQIPCRLLGFSERMGTRYDTHRGALPHQLVDVRSIANVAISQVA